MSEIEKWLAVLLLIREVQYGLILRPGRGKQRCRGMSDLQICLKGCGVEDCSASFHGLLVNSLEAEKENGVVYSLENH